MAIVRVITLLVPVLLSWRGGRRVRGLRFRFVRLVHTSLGSSYFIAHVLHCSPRAHREGKIEREREILSGMILPGLTAGALGPSIVSFNTNNSSYSSPSSSPPPHDGGFVFSTLSAFVNTRYKRVPIVNTRCKRVPSGCLVASFSRF
jgi:hypothetical protein